MVLILQVKLVLEIKLRIFLITNQNQVPLK